MHVLPRGTTYVKSLCHLANTRDRVLVVMHVPITSLLGSCICVSTADALVGVFGRPDSRGMRQQPDQGVRPGRGVRPTGWAVIPHYARISFSISVQKISISSSVV